MHGIVAGLKRWCSCARSGPVHFCTEIGKSGVFLDSIRTKRTGRAVECLHLLVQRLVPQKQVLDNLTACMLRILNVTRKRVWENHTELKTEARLLFEAHAIRKLRDMPDRECCLSSLGLHKVSHEGWINSFIAYPFQIFRNDGPETLLCRIPVHIR